MDEKKKDLERQVLVFKGVPKARRRSTRRIKKDLDPEGGTLSVTKKNKNRERRILSSAEEKKKDMERSIWYPKHGRGDEEELGKADPNPKGSILSVTEEKKKDWEQLFCFVDLSPSSSVNWQF